MRPDQLVRRGAAALARERRARHFRAIAKSGRRKDVLFVSGPGGEAPRYRCHHQAEQLALHGLSSDVGYHDELDLVELVDRYERFVLYRVPWDERVERFVDVARTRGKPVVADVDDLVFDARKSALIYELSLMNGDVRRAQEESIARLGQTLSALDGVVVSTEPLRTAAAAFNPRVAVAHNAVSAEMVEAGARAARGRRQDGEVVVAYLSGTSTHDRDFLEAADAVLWALDLFPQLRFWAVGFLSLDERFDAYGERVVRVPYRPWRRLPELLAGIDVSLAPLEAENEFTNAKSCLKYLEAGVVGVPTIASRRSDFLRAVEPGVNGFLADGVEAWQAALGELVESPARRREVGEAARSDVLANHTTRARAAATHEALALAAGPSAD